MTFTPNFITKVVTTLAILPILTTPAPAQAAGGPCYTATIATNMERDIRGGATSQQAFNWAVEDGIATDSTRCITRMRGYTQEMKIVFPHTHYAFN